MFSIRVRALDGRAGKAGTAFMIGAAKPAP
jgi:hypothetical protein